MGDTSSRGALGVLESLGGNAWVCEAQCRTNWAAQPSVAAPSSLAVLLAESDTSIPFPSLPLLSSPPSYFQNYLFSKKSS